MTQTSPKSRKAPVTSSCVFWVMVVAFFIAAGISAYLVYTFTRNTTAVFWDSIPGLSLVEGEQPTQPAAVKLPDLNAPLQTDDGPPPQAWDGSSRVTLLLMGLDARAWEANDGPPRTDTLILVTVDPGSRTTGMLSIPRDLWVDIPGFGYHKINQAYFLGEANPTDGGGAGLAMATVANTLEVPIQYYAQIDFNAFVQFIDEIGGVKLDVPEPMVVDPTGDNNTRLLKPGIQTLPGDIALAYARARNTAGSDFDRSQRQQQVIMAVRQRILSFELLPSLLAKAPVLYTQLSTGVTTNLSLQQIIQLAWMAYQVPEGNIAAAAIGVNQITFGTSLEGMDILYPVTEEIFKLRNQLFSTTDPESPVTVLDLSISERMVAEDANVSVRNGTETIGLAARTDIYLRDLGVNVSEVTNAEQLYANTTLIDHSGKPYTIEYLTEIFRVAPSRIYHRHDANSEIDVIILLGEDWATNNPMP